MTKSTFKILFLIAILTSCKKKETESTPQSVNSLFAVVNSPYTLSTAASFNGLFTTSAWAQKTGTVITGGNVSDAFFTDSAVTTSGQSNGLQMNTVKHNGINLEWRTTFTDYADYNTSNFDNELWQIKGTNGIPSFNFTNSNTPKCNNLSALPDSISLSAGFTISLNLSNITPIGYEFSISDGYNTSTAILKSLYNGNNTLTFTPADLGAFSVFGNASIMLNLENDQTLNFFGKDFKFTKHYQYLKNIRIRP